MATPVIVNIPHDLGRVEARRRLERGMGQLREQIAGKAVGFEERWDGDTLHFSAGALGQKISGRIQALDATVRMEVDLPWILASIAEKVKGKLQKTGTLLLEKK